MQAQNQTLATHVTKVDFKTLAQQTGLCLSLFLSKTRPAKLGTEAARSVIHTIEEQLSKRNLSKAEQDEFLKPVRELIGTEWNRDREAASAAMFRSPQGLW